MGDISKHFSRSECACKGKNCCSHTAVVDMRLVDALEAFRRIVGQPVSPSSWWRCLTHNRSTGSKDTSTHVLGEAADIPTLPGMTVDEMAEAAEQVPAFANGGIGKYSWGIHVDVRRGRARWDKR